MTKPTRFYDAAGKPVTLTVGQTFVQVLPHGIEGDDQGRQGPGREPGPATSASPAPRHSRASASPSSARRSRRSPGPRSRRRPMSAPRRRAAPARPRRRRDPGSDRLVAPGGRQRHRQPLPIARFDEDAGRAHDLRQRPDRGGDDRDTGRQGIDGDESARLRHDRQDHGPRRGDDRGGVVGRQDRRVHELVAGAVARGDPGERRAIVGRGVDDEDAAAASPPRRARPAGRAVDASEASAAISVARVLSDVVATRVDEVSIAEAESLDGGAGGRPGARARAERAAAYAGRGASGTTWIRSRRRCRSRRADSRDRIRADEDRGGVAQQPGAQPLAEPRRGPALEGLGQLPRREIQERHDRRQARRDRHGVARRVIHGPAAPPRSARQAAPTDAPRSTNGSTVSAAWRSSRVGGSRRRPTTSSRSKRVVGSSSSEARRNANDSPGRGSASKPLSNPSR